MFANELLCSDSTITPPIHSPYPCRSLKLIFSRRVMNSTPQSRRRPPKESQPVSDAPRKRGRPRKDSTGSKLKLSTKRGEKERRESKTRTERLRKLRKRGTGSFLGRFDVTKCERNDVGMANQECVSCGSLNFPGERVGTQSKGHFSICCQNGSISLPVSRQLTTLPDFFVNLLTGQDSKSKEFRDNIRQYNSALAFASLRVNIDIGYWQWPIRFQSSRAGLP